MEASARTGVSPQRFSRRNMLRFLCGALGTQRLAVAMEHIFPLTLQQSDF